MHSAFFMVQLSHPYMTTGKKTNKQQQQKNMALNRWTFVGKAMSLLFNVLSRFVIAFLPRSKSFNFMAAVTICSNFGAQENKVCHCFHCFPSICQQVMGLDAMILVFWILSFKPDFPLSFTLIKRLWFLHKLRNESTECLNPNKLKWEIRIHIQKHILRCLPSSSWMYLHTLRVSSQLTTQWHRWFALYPQA